MLYLFPTKALAQDQLAELEELAKTLPDMRMFTYDGDTPQDARRAVRARANLVLTNPDMLHAGILPHHTKWVNLFQNLRYVVIDELHAYRGVFGSHLANVLRRLKRICRHYGATPQFIWPRPPSPTRGELAERLTGEPVVEVERERRADRREDVPLLQPAGGQPRARHPRALSRRGGQARDPRFLKPKIATIVFAQSRLADRGAADLASRRRSRTRRATPASCAATAAATCRCAGARSSRGCARARCWAWCRRTRSSWASTSASSTWRCSPAIPAPSPPSGSRRAAPGGAAAQSAAILVATSSPDRPVPGHASRLPLRRAARARADQSRQPLHPRQPPQVRGLRAAVRGRSERFGGDVSALPGRARGRGACSTGRASATTGPSETYPADHLSLRTVTSRQLPRRSTPRARDADAGQAAADHRRGRLEERLRHDLSQGDLPGRGRAVRGAGAALPRGRGEGRLRQARGGRLLHRRGQRQGRVDPPALRRGRSTPGLPRRAGRGAGGREGGRLQEDQDGHDGERGLGRGRAAAAGDADDQRLAHAADPGLLAEISPAPRRAGRRAPRPDLPPPSPGPDLPPVRHPRPRLLARRRARRRGRAGGRRASPRGRGSSQAEQFKPTIYLYDNQPGGIGLAERLFEVLPDLLARGLETLEACALPARLPVVRGAR